LGEVLTAKQHETDAKCAYCFMLLRRFLPAFGN
jgi:hypothetical protein